MTRAEKRKLKATQPNAFRELLKVQKHFLKGFDSDLKNVKDPRHQSYIEYGINEILYAPILKNICNIKSMQEMTDKLNTSESIINYSTIMNNKELNELPHYVTVNECLKLLEPKELEKLRKKMIKKLIRKRSFENARFLDEYWLIIVDATQIYHFKEKHCEHCLRKTYTNKETGEKKIVYYHNVLEAKIVLGDKLIISMGTEFIENEKEDVDKQDCEINAFKRLSKKLKKDFPGLPICIMGDSLYAAESIFKICDENRWKFLIRFKDGSIPSIAEEFHTIKQMGEASSQKTINWVNGIAYNKREVNVMDFIYKKKDKNTTFQWITDIEITPKKAKEFAQTGRKRWKIENEGFNIQKNHRYDITHANSLDYNAMKNHYLIIQIADIILQLYTIGSKILRVLKKTIKNISSDLLNCFAGTVLTKEDILYTEKRTAISIS